MPKRKGGVSKTTPFAQKKARRAFNARIWPSQNICQIIGTEDYDPIVRLEEVQYSSKPVFESLAPNFIVETHQAGMIGSGICTRAATAGRLDRNYRKNAKEMQQQLT